MKPQGPQYKPLAGPQLVRGSISATAAPAPPPKPQLPNWALPAAGVLLGAVLALYLTRG